MLIFSVVFLHEDAGLHMAADTRPLLVKNWLLSQCFNNNDELMEGVKT
jgi:hypothetical protein